MSFKNVYIYVSDALRYDSVPDSIAEGRDVIPTLAPGAYTPICFSSLVTGKDPRKHSVRSFYDILDTENVFDYFDNHCYYDHPEDAMCKNVFGNYTASKELDEMEEPFFYVERALDTHAPYGEVKHGNKIPETNAGGETIKERYQKGIDSTEQHFWEHVRKLKELGLYEDTLIIFTSDHGELLGERKVFRKRKGHNKPMCKELNIVPTVFVNAEVNFGRARLIDIVPTALSFLDKDTSLTTDGVDLNSGQPDKGYSMLQINTRPLLTTGCTWRWQNGWQPSLSKIKTDIATIGIDLFNPLRKKARNSKLADFVRPETAKDYESIYERDEKDKELEDIDF